MSKLRVLLLSVLLAASTLSVSASAGGPDVAAPATTSMRTGDGLCC